MAVRGTVQPLAPTTPTRYGVRLRLNHVSDGLLRRIATLLAERNERADLHDRLMNQLASGASVFEVTDQYIANVAIVMHNLGEHDLESDLLVTIGDPICSRPNHR